MTNKKIKVILAAGGTGGHIFPARSLADELIKKHITTILVTDHRFFSYDKMAKYDFSSVKKIRCSSPSGDIVKKIRGLFDLSIGLLQALKFLKKEKPNVVVGFGGYISFPTIVAAKILRIKIIIHEQNAVLGRVNKFLSKYADIIAMSFKSVTGIKKEYAKKIKFTGNPVRDSIVSIRKMPYPELERHEHFRILVTGGSQGASVFSEIIPKAIAMIPDDLQKRIRIDQQCGKGDIEKLVNIYENLNVNADLAPFFTDIPERLASAHLVIARAGASTIAENLIAGRPTILIPYPYALDDHQTKNAKILEKKNAAILVKQDENASGIIAEKLEYYISNYYELKKIATSAKEIATTDAADKLCELVLEHAK